jgi:hypothetical protein
MIFTYNQMVLKPTTTTEGNGITNLVGGWVCLKTKKKQFVPKKFDVGPFVTDVRKSSLVLVTGPLEIVDLTQAGQGVLRKFSNKTTAGAGVNSTSLIPTPFI